MTLMPMPGFIGTPMKPLFTRGHASEMSLYHDISVPRHLRLVPFVGDEVFGGGERARPAMWPIGVDAQWTTIPFEHLCARSPIFFRQMSSITAQGRHAQDVSISLTTDCRA